MTAMGGGRGGGGYEVVRWSEQVRGGCDVDVAPWTNSDSEKESGNSRLFQRESRTLNPVT